MLILCLSLQKMYLIFFKYSVKQFPPFTCVVSLYFSCYQLNRKPVLSVSIFSFFVPNFPAGEIINTNKKITFRDEKKEKSLKFIQTKKYIVFQRNFPFFFLFQPNFLMFCFVFYLFHPNFFFHPKVFCFLFFFSAKFFFFRSKNRNKHRVVGFVPKICFKL